MTNPAIEDIVHIVAQAIHVDPAVVRSAVTAPPDPSMGDYALPCFVLSKELNRPPAEVAQELVTRIQGARFLETAECAGPYLNIWARRPAVTEEVLGQILSEKRDYGSSTEGADKAIVIDLSSPNIAKPMSIGHLRSTVIGNSLGNILHKLGYQVVGINHLGDWGTQFGKQIVAYLKWGEGKEELTVRDLLDSYVRFHDEAEVHPELDDEARLWFKRLEDGDPEARRIWKRFVSISMDEFRKIYDRLGIEFDHYTGESFYNQMLDDTIEQLDKAGLTQVSQGALIVDLEPYDMPPVLLRKADGASLYETREIAAVLYRYRTFHFHKMLYVVGSDQKLHFRQLFKVLELMGYPWAKGCLHIDFGMVRLTGQKMSTREGRVVFLDEVLDKAVELTKQIIEEKNPDLEDRDEVAEQVGIGAIIFADLSTKRTKDVDFRWEEVLNFDGRTGPYVQYTHVRLCGILRKFGCEEEHPPDLPPYDPCKLATEDGWILVKMLADYPATVNRAAEAYEPSVVANYLLDLSEQFNRYYHHHRVVTGDTELTNARVALVTALRYVIADGLDLLGLRPLMRM
jgi:arginyl-tRNA synthetase